MGTAPKLGKFSWDTFQPMPRGARARWIGRGRNIAMQFYSTTTSMTERGRCKSKKPSAKYWWMFLEHLPTLPCSETIASGEAWEDCCIFGHADIQPAVMSRGL